MDQGSIEEIVSRAIMGEDREQLLNKGLHDEFLMGLLINRARQDGFGELNIDELVEAMRLYRDAQRKVVACFGRYVK